jgi:hypothetical protein
MTRRRFRQRDAYLRRNLCQDPSLAVVDRLAMVKACRITPMSHRLWMTLTRPPGMVPLAELELRPFSLQELVAALDSEDMVVVLGASRDK